MASSSFSGVVSVVAVLGIVLAFGGKAQASTSISDFLSPLLAPVFDEVCKEVECGKGTCKPSSNGTFLFECVCDSGWKQTASVLDDHLKFLPCIIPNCTMDYSCSESFAPPPPSSQSNYSLFDPCSWNFCGGGLCNKTSQFTYNCECAQGYTNLLNITTFPCFKECAIGMDCSTLGIITSNNSTSSAPPVLSDNGVNEGMSIKQDTLLCVTIAIVSLLMIL